MELVRLENVNKTYSNGEVETKALVDIDLAIDQGELIVILGPSGSGKSTLLNVISGLDSITSGKIFFENELISTYKEKQLTQFRRKNLGFIFQQYNLLQTLDVKDNVKIGSEIASEPLDVDETLEAVGLSAMAGKFPYQLSGGEQQRVSVARSVVKNPKIMLCDEPTGALDQTTGQQVLELLERLNTEYKMTLMIITHNPNIAQMADRVIKMNSGRITAIEKNVHKRKAGDIEWA